eukprot:CAMPEP_0172380010 /NCGR_PEP_ID=MMETSP1060-20121228/70218_1 /TAXON_ID=37318 /ORGANISM="Pseudo-nitzschia pungens, Strain cf. cingulata" /LENGTH=307 /DNA_ID=CAMNT_0013107755 /DNA_START=336 /DNA_END=1259 /DNA_ORIENTATION=+
MPVLAHSWKLLGGGVVALALSSMLLTGQNSKTAISVAFVGNSLAFVNDLPRVVETMSEGQIAKQDSCLHGRLTVTELLETGNGMYYFWADDDSDRSDNDGFPDFGACSVPQLLLGYDEGIADDNFEDYYTIDGLNPCFEDPDYLEYATATRSPENDESSNKDSASRWDYVVINDQSMHPAVYYDRMESASTLLTVYVPMLNASNSIPILYQTWGYWREDIDMTGFVDVPTFTTRLREGYEYYSAILTEALPRHLTPRIAPVGSAFLVVWEENLSVWNRLFGEDLYHPSPHGVDVCGCVWMCVNVFDE